MAVIHILYVLKLKRLSVQVSFIAPLSLFSKNCIHAVYLFVMTYTATVQSQLCGALTFSLISLYFAGK